MLQDSRMERQKLFEAAKMYFDKADTVRRYAERTLLNTAWAVLNISEGNSWRRADYYFTNAKRANEVRASTSSHICWSLLPPFPLSLTNAPLLFVFGGVDRRTRSRRGVRTCWR